MEQQVQKVRFAYTNECLTFVHVLSFKLLLLVGLADGPLKTRVEVKLAAGRHRLAAYYFLHSTTLGTVISTVYRKSLRLSFTLLSRIDHRLSLLSDCRHSEVCTSVISIPFISIIWVPISLKGISRHGLSTLRAMTIR